MLYLTFSFCSNFVAIWREKLNKSCSTRNQEISKWIVASSIRPKKSNDFFTLNSDLASKQCSNHKKKCTLFKYSTTILWYRVSHNYLDWAKYQNRHSLKSIWVMKLIFCQNDCPIRESFWQKISFITHILFELCLFWYLAQSR